MQECRQWGLISRFVRGLWVLGLHRWLLPNAIVVQDQELQVDREIF
ncbi:hypothetical protein QUA74_09525 [Microcoleus sp. LAD1_D3]